MDTPFDMAQARLKAAERMDQTLARQREQLAEIEQLRKQQSEILLNGTCDLFEAVQQYEFTTDTETRAVGFVTTDCGRIGCSPDRLVIGHRGGLEIKVCAPGTHIGYLLDGVPETYRPQVMGQLAVAELEWCDLYAFHDRLPPVTIRTYRDDHYIAKMMAALAEFLDMRDAMLTKARASGFCDQAMEAV